MKQLGFVIKQQLIDSKHTVILANVRISDNFRDADIHQNDILFCGYDRLNFEIKNK